MSMVTQWKTRSFAGTRLHGQVFNKEWEEDHKQTACQLFHVEIGLVLTNQFPGM